MTKCVYPRSIKDLILVSKGRRMPSSPLWRWNGEEWEHKCGGPQEGHWPAVDFGIAL
jgi:hypothetical protein